MQSKLPFTLEQIQPIVETFGTPFYVYDERGIRASVRALYDAFSWVPSGFDNYFAVKATPTPRVIQPAVEQGCGLDCSSELELSLAADLDVSGERIMYTANNMPRSEMDLACGMGAIVTLDDVVHAGYLTSDHLPPVVSFRFNPPFCEDNAIDPLGGTGSKFGMTRKQILQAFDVVYTLGVRRFGLHIMQASGVLDNDFFVNNAQTIFDVATWLKQERGVQVEFIDLGGGIGLPYHEEDTPVDLGYVSSGIKEAYNRIGWHPKLMMECGRFITGPHGYLVTTVRQVTDKRTNEKQKCVGVDASMADLPGPGIHGSDYPLSVLTPHGEEMMHAMVHGSVCFLKDVSARNREMPVVEAGALLVYHMVGAHERAEASNYNGKTRCGELLLRTDGGFEVAREHETLDQIKATIPHQSRVF